MFYNYFKYLIIVFIVHNTTAGFYYLKNGYKRYNAITKSSP